MRVKELVAEARSPLCSINFSRNAIAPKHLLNASQKKELNILRHSSALIGVVAVHFIAIVSGQKSPASCSLFFSEIANQKQRNEQLHDRQWEKMPFFGALFGLLRCRVRLRAARVYAFRVAKICAQVNKPREPLFSLTILCLQRSARLVHSSKMNAWQGKPNKEKQKPFHNRKNPCEKESVKYHQQVLVKGRNTLDFWCISFRLLSCANFCSVMNSNHETTLNRPNPAAHLLSLF